MRSPKPRYATTAAAHLPDARAAAYLPIGAGFGAGAGDPLGGVVPAFPGLLAGAGAGAIPTGVPALTVTLVCPETLPCVAVICAVPGDCPVTFPLASTLATDPASLLHTT